MRWETGELTEQHVPAYDGGVDTDVALQLQREATLTTTEGRRDAT